MCPHQANLMTAIIATESVISTVRLASNALAGNGLAVRRSQRCSSGQIGGSGCVAAVDAVIH
jgi:hypothetical protein